MIHISKATVSTFALALFFCLGGDVFACSCARPGPPCQEYWRADAVFVGLVKSKEIKEEISKTPSGELKEWSSAQITDRCPSLS